MAEFCERLSAIQTPNSHLCIFWRVVLWCQDIQCFRTTVDTLLKSWYHITSLQGQMELENQRTHGAQTSVGHWPESQGVVSMRKGKTRRTHSAEHAPWSYRGKHEQRACVTLARVCVYVHVNVLKILLFTKTYLWRRFVRDSIHANIFHAKLLRREDRREV